MNLVAILFHSLILIFLLTLLGNFFLNQWAVPRLKPGSNLDIPPPLVSILVPARNEEASIRRCLASLQAQDYPNCEIILLDDQSSDATAAIARDLGFSEVAGKHQIISGRALEKGWIGKCWACHQLSQAARGEYLLFTDADTDHAPFALQAAMVKAVSSGADLLTLWPEQETKTWSEKLIIPFLYIAAAGMVPHWMIRLGQKYPRFGNRISAKQWRGMGVANGQYVLFSRSGYERIGGHFGVRHEMVEDVSLGRLAAEKLREGFVLLNCDGTGVIKTRMYRSFREVWEGFTKNAWPVFDGNKVAFFGGLAMQWVLFALPFFLLPLAGSAWNFILAEVILILCIRCILTIRYRSSWLGVFGHLIGVFLATAIALNSFFQSRRGGLAWKGRVYPHH